MIPASNINIKPVIYEKNTDGSYILNNDGKKIIDKIGNEVSPYDDYEYFITITEEPFVTLNDVEIKIPNPLILNNIQIKVIQN